VSAVTSAAERVLSGACEEAGADDRWQQREAAGQRQESTGRREAILLGVGKALKAKPNPMGGSGVKQNHDARAGLNR
jgi:hypothetical protein